MNDLTPLPPVVPLANAQAAAELVAAAADLALVLDDAGVIRTVHLGHGDTPLGDCQAWVGRPWSETVTVESRPKVAALLREAGGTSARRWRHINHPTARGADLPLLYSAIRLDGGVLAFARDQSATAALQQRLVEAQQSMERDYQRLRQMETRYRLLFNLAAEPVLVVDATTQKVLEANPAAGTATGESIKRLVGRPFAECFEPGSRGAVLALLSRVPAAGGAEETRATLLGDARASQVSASLFRQENGNLYLVRLAGSQREPAAGEASVRSQLLDALEAAPDAFVVTDLDGRVLSANTAFAEMLQLAGPEQAQGQSLDRWLGRSGIDLNVLLAALRQHGSVRLFATTVTGAVGLSTPVEISATSVPHGQPPCLGFTLRDVGRRLGPEPAALAHGKELPRSVAQLTELVGRVPLKDIVGETTDLIEQLCIQAALELTHDNRASAAEMLGLSRQSLYVKLRRYGMGDLGTEAER